jgi:hypothetical protein
MTRESDSTCYFAREASDWFHVSIVNGSFGRGKRDMHATSGTGEGTKSTPPGFLVARKAAHAAANPKSNFHK